MPMRICFTVMAGFHDFSSFRMDTTDVIIVSLSCRARLLAVANSRHTVPEGYTFGWNSGGVNLPLIRQSERSVKPPRGTEYTRHLNNLHFGGLDG